MNRYLQGMAAILAVALLAPSAPAADADGCGDLEHGDVAQIREAANRRVELRAADRRHHRGTHPAAELNAS